ncbi:hypothetical protein ACFV4I_17155 [Nocardiopsis alba]|uniref:Putative membrane protein n=1 Tax=Nocardiopsis alba (strain ATCC BAA-2165 / BE74) TaxID=1205910 RepID=J7LB64_NOCAA|nr:hypothetical protein [Nocardiopsis alba]AFR10903.1 putative membrane protein [Nocardiopsis alba ATCC BAA-2165]
MVVVSSLVVGLCSALLGMAAYIAAREGAKGRSESFLIAIGMAVAALAAVATVI